MTSTSTTTTTSTTSPFLQPSFDPTTYANSFINSNSTSLSTALASLQSSLASVQSSLAAQVSQHHDSLLLQVSGLDTLDTVLSTVSSKLSLLTTTSLERLTSLVTEPYESLSKYQLLLTRAHACLDMLQKWSRFHHLYKRLVSTSSNPATSSLILNDMESLLSSAPELTDLQVVDFYLPHIRSIKKSLLSSTESLLYESLAKQDQPVVASCLQVYRNLGESVLDTRTMDIVQECIRRCFTTTTTTTTNNNNTNNNNIWARLEELSGKINESSRMVYCLEKVSNNSGTNNTNIWAYFWKQVTTLFDKEMKQVASSKIHFQTQYPQLLALFQSMFNTIAIYTPPAYHQLASKMFLQTLSHYEVAYLQKSLQRLFDPIQAAFTKDTGNTVVNREDAEKIVRVMANELELGHLLLPSIAKNMAKAIHLFTVKAESAVMMDSSAYQTTGPGQCTQSQYVNAELVNACYTLKCQLWKLINPDLELLVLPLESLNHVMIKTVEPLLLAIVKELETTILKAHKEDYNSSSATNNSNSCSSFVIEFSYKLKYIQGEILSRYHGCGQDAQEWIRSLACRVLGLYLRHTSMVRPLNETGKLKIANDLAQMEFVLNAWLQQWGLKLSSEEGELGRWYRVLRGLRPLLFWEDVNSIASLTKPPHSVPHLFVLHHLIVRAYPNIPFPFQSNEVQYLDALDAAGIMSGNEKSQVMIQMLEECVNVYVETVKRKGIKEFVVEYPVIKQVLLDWSGKSI